MSGAGGKERDERPCYLGDGVYATFDGYHIWLRTGAHEGPYVTNAIALEPSVFKALLKYQRELEALATKDGT